MKLSVIIPVFNTGHLVEKAIKSLDRITQVELEILCINDGSTDNSWELLKSLEEKYPQLKLINKENEGVARTRNQAILETTGDYVYFLDSDDWIKTESFDQLLIHCYKQYDIIHGNFSYVYEDRTIKDNKQQLEGIYSGQEFLCQGLLQDKISMACCNNIFRREFLLDHQLFFVEGIYQEDEEFNLRAFSYAEKICSKNYSIYMYLQRLESRSNDGSKELARFNDVIFIYKTILQFLNQSTHVSKEYRNMCSTYVSFMVLLGYAKQNDLNTVKSSETTIKNLKLYQTIHSDVLIYKISKLALQVAPITYIRLLRHYFKTRSKKL